MLSSQAWGPEFWSPSTQLESWIWQGTPIILALSRQWLPRAHWPASPAETMSCRFGEWLSKKKITIEGDIERHLTLATGLHMYLHTNSHALTHTYAWNTTYCTHTPYTLTHTCTRMNTHVHAKQVALLPQHLKAVMRWFLQTQQVFRMMAPSPGAVPLPSTSAYKVTSLNLQLFQPSFLYLGKMVGLCWENAHLPL